MSVVLGMGERGRAMRSRRLPVARPRGHSHRSEKYPAPGNVREGHDDAPPPGSAMNPCAAASRRETTRHRVGVRRDAQCRTTLPVRRPQAFRDGQQGVGAC